MSIRKYTVILFSLFLSSSYSYAFFCPKNFDQISIGDSIEAVETKCGKPDKITKKDPPDNAPQEWSYNIPQTVSVNSNQQEAGTLKTSFTFDDKGKAINISVNGIGVGASSICGQNVSLGDTRKKIKAACGKPTFITKGAEESAATPVPTDKKDADKDKIIEYTYNSTPPITLIFQDGKLTKRR